MKVQLYTCKLVKDGAPRAVATEFMDCAPRSLAVLRSLMVDLPHEEIWILLVNRRMAIQGAVKVSMGGVGGCAMKPIDVLRPVLASGFDSFVLAHNHPSGDPKPSADDLTLTRYLLKACEMVGLHFLDHLIVTNGPDWVSLSETTNLWSEHARNCES
jgi:DNA repair protein RadC